MGGHEAVARRKDRAERAIGELVMLNLARQALELPVGDRLAISHFALTASVSPMAIVMAWSWQTTAGR